MVISPGSGFPTDNASITTPVAHNAADVVRLADSAPSLTHLDGRSSVCRACPRLVAWREQVAEEKRASFASQAYWGRPITGWGDERPKIVVMGLAPAAHGGNRTGRIFTGDRSGDWLFAALHRAGLARIAESVNAWDGQKLIDTRITLPVRCAPPANKPTPEERAACSPWLERELSWLLPWMKVIVPLGAFGWASTFSTLRAIGVDVPSRAPRFEHGAEVTLPGGITVLGCFHVSQQNTFTGKLTEQMLDAVFTRARELAGLS
ncbi:MAG: Uracil-DNA glycosylase superfamily [Frankiales bacterium]|nr:Uracil-DNA glycosylase superfamily [Frankiales bacterium]